MLVSRMLLHPRSWFKNLGLDKVLGNVLTLSIGRGTTVMSVGEVAETIGQMMQ
jgi:hypothetical protein